MDFGRVVELCMFSHKMGGDVISVLDNDLIAQNVGPGVRQETLRLLSRR
jgi:hypothetical protein